jgi:hypothetical protein
MTETAADYAQLVEEVYLPDGTVHAVKKPKKGARHSC